MGKKRARKSASADQGESRSRKTRTGKKKQPEGVSDYAVEMAGGASVESAQDFENVTGIPAELALRSESSNQQLRYLHYAMDQLKEKKRRGKRDPKTEIRGSLVTDENRKKFIEMFENLHEKRGYGVSGDLTLKSLNPLFYANPSEIALPSEPTLASVDPLMMLTDQQIVDLCMTAVYQEFEILVQPHRKSGEFVLSTERKEYLDQAGWTFCPDAIQVDERFVTEFFVSRDGLWGLYVIQRPLGDDEQQTDVKGLNVAYYLYVPRLATY